jgi:hypothetical protein
LQNRSEEARSMQQSRARKSLFERLRHSHENIRPSMIKRDTDGTKIDTAHSQRLQNKRPDAQ